MNLTQLWTILYSGWIASEIYILLATRTKRGKGVIQDRGSLYILWVVIAICMTSAEVLSSFLSQNISHDALLLSLLILVSGLAIRWTAIASLGKYFSANVAILDGQRICRSGLYRYIRHPSYLGLLLIFLAVGLHFRNWIALAIAFVPPTAALLYRIHIEEIALNKAFGEEYSSYSNGTSRLIPMIY